MAQRQTAVRALMFAALLAATTACSAGSNSSKTTPDAAPATDASSDALGSGVITGSLGGRSITVRDAVSGCGLLASNPTLHVDLFNLAQACRALNGSLPATAGYLSFDFFTGSITSGMLPADAPGSYQVTAGDPTTPGSYAAVYFEDSKSLFSGKSGSVSLSVVSSARVVGTFDVTFLNGDHVTGRFDAPACAVRRDSSVPPGGLFVCP